MPLTSEQIKPRAAESPWVSHRNAGATRGGLFAEQQYLSFVTTGYRHTLSTSLHYEMMLCPSQREEIV